MRGDIENMDCLRDVLGKAMKDYPDDVMRKAMPLDQFVRNDVPSPLLASLESKESFDKKCFRAQDITHSHGNTE